MSSSISETRKNAGHSWLHWLPAVGFTAAAFWLLARSIQWEIFLRSLSAVPVGVWVLTIAIYLVSILLRAFGWQFLLQRKVSPGTVFLTLNEGYFFNNILPFRLGEIARAFLMGRRMRTGLFQVLPSIVVERSYDLVITASLLLLTLPLALGLDWAKPLAVLILAVILAGLCAMFLVARRQAWANMQLDRLGQRFPWLKQVGIPQLRAVLEGFSALTRVEFFAGSFAILALSWLLGITRDWLLIRVFVPGAPFWWAALGVGASNIFGAIPSVMASLGTFELGAVGALTLVGMSKESVLAYALIAHVTHLILSSLIGAFGLSQEGQTFTELYTEIRHSRSIPQ